MFSQTSLSHRRTHHRHSSSARKNERAAADFPRRRHAGSADREAHTIFPRSRYSHQPWCGPCFWRSHMRPEHIGHRRRKESSAMSAPLCTPPRSDRLLGGSGFTSPLMFFFRFPRCPQSAWRAVRRPIFVSTRSLFLSFPVPSQVQLRRKCAITHPLSAQSRNRRPAWTSDPRGEQAKTTTKKKTRSHDVRPFGYSAEVRVFLKSGGARL